MMYNRKIQSAKARLFERHYRKIGGAFFIYGGTDMEEKRIELCQMRAGDIKTGFGNPRKITKAKLEELRESFEKLGDFGIFIIDENNNVIGGNQRLKVVLQLFGPDQLIDCKRLIGYTEAEKRAINIKDNTHSGEWDLDQLADWSADISLDLGLKDQPKKEIEERSIKDMEPIHYEQYDYVIIACRNELDYNDLTRKLGIEGGQVKVAKTRRIKARAIWYDQMKAQILSAEELAEREANDGTD